MIQWESIPADFWLPERHEFVKHYWSRRDVQQASLVLAGLDEPNPDHPHELDEREEEALTKVLVRMARAEMEKVNLR